MTGFLLALAVFVMVRAWGQRRRRVHKVTTKVGPSATAPVLSFREAAFPCGCQFKDGSLTACEAHEALLEASR